MEQHDSVPLCQLSVSALSSSISGSSSLSVNPRSLYCNLSRILLLLLATPLCSIASACYSSQAGLMRGCPNIVKREPFSDDFT